MRLLMLGLSVGLKKKKNKKNLEKKNHKKSPKEALVPQDDVHIFGLTKCTIYCKSVLVFLHAVTMLIFQIKRIISSEKQFKIV